MAWDGVAMPDVSEGSTLTVVVPSELQPLLYARRRRGRLSVANDGVSTIGHVVGSLGIPLTEIGELLVGGNPVAAAWRPVDGAVVELLPRHRPQATPTSPPRFLLDVHLGTLARRMRLLGVDTAWHNHMTDDDLIRQAAREQRVILTRDRGLLLRRAARDGAYVRGNRPDEQLADVLDRFAPPLAPWSRCPACNATLVPVAKADVVEQLQPGTRRNYDTFACCSGCGRIYWDGAHHARLQQIVDRFCTRSA